MTAGLANQLHPQQATGIASGMTCDPSLSNEHQSRAFFFFFFYFGKDKFVSTEVATLVVITLEFLRAPWGEKPT